ncbi:hypothetical protein [Nitrosophilus labii]|uniref:hypothetical protein n=1 Tax=Nitrosophilus labii TaxID=2706014 RepID=UPI001656DB8B|nr:hypothetical protein [Nitrosophilus labii]
MGVKENIEYIKEELSNEEKMLEQIVKAERFYKRHKKTLITLIFAAILGFMAYVGYELVREHNLKLSNEAYLKLLANPKDSEALKTLKEKNPTLYTVFEFREAIKNNDAKKLEEIASKDISIISNIAKYQAASLLREQEKLKSYQFDQKAILRDLAILDEAFLLYEKDSIKEAREKLKNVKENSIVYPYAQFLLHYGIKGNM